MGRMTGREEYMKTAMSSNNGMLMNIIIKRMSDNLHGLQLGLLES